MQKEFSVTSIWSDATWQEIESYFAIPVPHKHTAPRKKHILFHGCTSLWQLLLHPPQVLCSPQSP